MTKDGLDEIPLPEVRFLVARNRRARASIALLCLVGIYLLSSMVATNHENKVLSARNGKLNEANLKLSKEQVERQGETNRLAKQFLTLVANLEAEVQRLGGTPSQSLKEQIKELLDQTVKVVPSVPKTNVPDDSQPVQPRSTSSTVAPTTSVSVTTSTVSSTPTTGSSTTTTTSPVVSSTTTTRSFICVLNQLACIRVGLRSTLCWENSLVAPSWLVMQLKLC